MKSLPFPARQAERSIYFHQLAGIFFFFPEKFSTLLDLTLQLFLFNTSRWQMLLSMLRRATEWKRRKDAPPKSTTSWSTPGTWNLTTDPHSRRFSKHSSTWGPSPTDTEKIYIFIHNVDLYFEHFVLATIRYNLKNRESLRDAVFPDFWNFLEERAIQGRLKLTIELLHSDEKKEYIEKKKKLK